MDHTRMTIPEPPPFTGKPPPLGAEPRLYALLAVEVKPGTIVYYHLELDPTPGACTIDMERHAEPMAVDDLLVRYVYSPIHVTATISGTVVSDRPDYRPPARTAATVADRALPAPEPAAITGDTP